MSERSEAADVAEPTAQPTAQPAGVIHDIGYRRYDGPRLGLGYVTSALYGHGLRAAFGLGRGVKAKIFPWFVVSVVGITAVVLAMVRSQIGDTGEIDRPYLEFVDVLSWLVVFFVAIVGPELVSRDLRAGVLPLYFSRPMGAVHYVAAKLAALATATWLLLGAPQLLMVAIVGFSADDRSAVRAELGEFWPGLLYASLWAVVFAAIGLLVASLTGKRAVAAGGIVAVFLMTIPIVAVLVAVPSQTVNDLAGLFSPPSLLQGIRMWSTGMAPPDEGPGVGDFGPLYGATAAVLVAGCVALLLVRYRKVASS